LRYNYIGTFESLLSLSLNQKTVQFIRGRYNSNNIDSPRGYDFLESSLFYFKNSPEELYYISFVGDSATFADTTQVSIAVRAVTNESSGWQLEKDVSSGERNRIELRFRKEIVEKLERITNCRAS